MRAERPLDWIKRPTLVLTIHPDLTPSQIAATLEALARFWRTCPQNPEIELERTLERSS